jgi:hypothetical protein
MENFATTYTWENLDGYLRWLHTALEHLKHSRFVYDKKGSRLFYNKPYWEFRFKVEIKRIERMLELEQRIMLECDVVA